jgi:hypothetical protein
MTIKITKAEHPGHRLPILTIAKEQTKHLQPAFNSC